MDLIRFSITRPVVIGVGVILILLFGFIGLDKLPYQLTPNVIEPEVTVRTLWPGATPYEIERDIIEEQEDVLKSIPALVKYESSSFDNYGEITLTFKVGTSLDAAVLEVSNKLGEVPDYPENVEQPVIKSSGATASPVVWTIMETVSGDPERIATFRTYYENEIREHLERVEGVSELMVFGGSEQEVHVVVDPKKLAAYGLGIDELVARIQAENSDISAGTMDISRRAYRIRTVGAFDDLAKLEDMIIRSDGQRRIRVRDVARVEIGYNKEDAVAMIEGKPGIVAGFITEPGANVVDTTNRIEAAVNKVNEEILKPQGLFIRWLHDKRPYIMGAVDLVKTNIAIGGALAIFILLLFLRSLSATGIVALAIPISIIATFMILYASGRSLNTISLAGISFAVGMLVDSAIVVLENIVRHRAMGKGYLEAAYDGSSEVWGALIASALTTVAVFLPIIFLEDEAGQLFKDIAIAVTSAVMFSLFVSISVIPMLYTQLLRFVQPKEKTQRPSLLVHIGATLASGIMRIVRWALHNVGSRIATIAALTAVSILSIWSLFPKMEYLPQGNRNLIMNILIPPPGLSLDERREIAHAIFDRIEPHMDTPKDGLPGIHRNFFVTWGDIIITGVISSEEQRARELIPFMLPIINSFPGIFGISKQAGVFEEGIGKGRTVDIDISGKSVEQITNVGGMLFGTLRQSIEGAQIRPIPSVELIFPEVRIVPDRERLQAVGLDTRNFGTQVDVLMDGRKIGEFKAKGEKKVDLVLTADETMIDTPQALYRSRIVTPSGHLIPLSELATLENTAGVSSIRHYNGKRTVTLQVTPPSKITIQEAIEMIDGGILPKLKEQGMLEGVDVTLSGTAGKLSHTVDQLAVNIILALIITYLLMSALFGNFLYPMVIMFTVPLATAGGFVGLAMTNALIAPQPLDILTMLGFIILIGIVVNNAILIVHQSLNYIRNHAMERKDAVLEATKSRLRPIYMSSITSVIGMMPLVLIPGPGAEFYRGLGSVITGGLAISTIFTIFLTPALLMFFIGMEKDQTKGDEA